MYTLEQIKHRYYFELTLEEEARGFDQYLKEMYVQVFDNELNFLGYDEEGASI